MVVEVSHLKVSYFTRKGELKAVDDVSFSMGEGETIGIVGESGCGKTTLGFAMSNLISPPGRIVDGTVKLNGRDVLKLESEDLRRVRGKQIAMIFQDPMTSLNPVKKIGDHFVETIRAHFPEVRKEDSLKKAEETLEQLGIPSERLGDYPHQLSGGMKQRIMIGLGLVLDPEVLIADEPTTALDVIIEAQILDLIGQLKAKLKLSMVLITHNLGVVAEVADKIAIMYAGQIMELADAKTLFRHPLFPYTQLLLKMVPNLETETASLEWIPGSPPDLTLEQRGCRFAPRCPYVFDRCKKEAPQLREVEPGHLVACHLYDSGQEK